MSTVPTISSMKSDHSVDRLFAGLPCLCDGAMGTMLLARGISLDRCYEELNLSQPETIADVHTDYLRAGAQIIETNTFGANSHRLARLGLHKQVIPINLAGVHIARQCANQFPTKSWVAGSVGPLGERLEPLGPVSRAKARFAFAEQIGALAEGGPGVGIDLLMIETMTSLAEAAEAIHAAQQTAPQLPMVVMMTFNELDHCLDGTSVEAAAARLTALGANAVGCNCSDGPATALRVIERMRSATHLPLAAMPNAGIPSMQAGRITYPISPQDVADFARKAIHAGATFVGGCCGTTPEHIRAMKLAFAAGV